MTDLAGPLLKHNVTGTEEGELLEGTTDAEILAGLAGNDTLDGNGGADTLNGGQGLDTVLLDGAPGDYATLSVDGGTRVLSAPGGIELTLIDVERLAFSSGAVTDVAFNALTSPGLISGLGGDAGFGENILDRNDDGSTAQIDASLIFENGINFFGTVYSGFWINNNGSITFEGPRSTYTPNAITETSNNPEITPYFADVDTRGGLADPTPGGNSMGTNLVYWDFNEATDQIIITWDDVGYYASHIDLLNAFQLILTDQGNGDFDIEFRYEDVNWTTGDASSGSGGLGGVIARAGYTAGTGDPEEYFELPQSGDQDAMLSLDVIPGNTGLIGLWEFFVRNGGVVESVVPLLPTDGTGGWVTGDPHLSTLDGVGYDFQAAGEFVLLRGTASDFEIQARMTPVAENVSVNSAVATNLGGTAVMIDATDDTPLHIAGVPTTVTDFGFVEVGNDRIYREGDTYTIVYAGADDTVNNGDSQLIVTVREDRVDLDIRLNAELLGSLEGLLGDGDGDTSNDIALADGTPLARPLVFEDVYGTYRDDWRVTSDAQSLFTYDDGETLAGFYNADFPASAVSLDDLDPAVLAAAEDAATNAGLTPGTPNFENAVLDFALTGDASFLDSAVEVPQTVTETVTTEEPVPLTLTGTPGPDSLVGGFANDTIDGLAGEDTIVGRAGDDRLLGGDGRDLIDAGAGDDAVLGQGGDDTLSGGDGNDNIAASDGNDVVNGDAGDDLMGGGLGDDVMNGGTGRDFMGGGLGNDTVDGGEDGDVVNGGGGDDVLIGGAGNDTMGGSFNFDVVDGGDGNDDMGGGLGQDTVTAGDGDDSVGGGEGNDVIDGGAGADFLAGGGRDDVIDGGVGADQINAGDGDDTMTGGGGADLFIFNSFRDGDADVITDFTDGVDSFRMTGVENAPGTGLQGKLDALNITDTAGGALIDYQGHTVLIEGVAAADLGLDDFTFL